MVAVECGGWSAAELGGARAVYASPADLLERYASSAFPMLSRSLERTF
jgi:hypothetical protein